MIHNLTPYPKYQETRTPWLGQVPSHWKLLPGRACFQEKKVPNSGLKETTVLSLSFGQIVVKPAEKLHGLVPASFETYQIVEPGDIIVRPTDLQNDWVSLRFGLSRNRGIITSAYLCFQTKPVMTREYGHFLLHTYDLKKIFYGLGSGLRQNLDWKDFKYLPCVVPSIPEQNAIVRFLDYMDRRINRYIRTKKNLISLLNEQKQAIIKQAVTRGLDPTVHLKPSTIEGLGEIPAHWEIRPLKRWVYINKQTLRESTDEDFEFRYIDIGTIRTGRLLHPPMKMHFKNAPSRARRILRNGDTIVSTVRTYLKAVWSVNDDAGDLIASTGFAVLTPRPGIDPEYLGYVIQSNNFVSRVSVYSTGTTYPAITETVLGRFLISIPPSLVEQRDLVKWIESESAPFEKGIDNAQKEITFLQEYRTRLIADVVTGKLDIREASSHLLYKTEAFGPNENNIEFSEDSESDEESGLDASTERVDA